MSAVACRQYQAFMLALSLLLAFPAHLKLKECKEEKPQKVMKFVLICHNFCGSICHKFVLICHMFCIEIW